MNRRRRRVIRKLSKWAVRGDRPSGPGYVIAVEDVYQAYGELEALEQFTRNYPAYGNAVARKLK